jgi:hypothetical protein
MALSVAPKAVPDRQPGGEKAAWLTLKGLGCGVLGAVPAVPRGRLREPCTRA